MKNLKMPQKRCLHYGCAYSKRGFVMKKVKWIPPDLTVLARENPEKHVLTARKANNALETHQMLETKVKLDSIYVLSKDIAARYIEGEIIIAPIASEIGAMEDALCTLNETGRAIWEYPDGRRTLKDMVEELSAQFDAPPSVIEKDVCGFAEELLKRHMLVESA
jgi:hypothetical protein